MIGRAIVMAMAAWMAVSAQASERGTPFNPARDPRFGDARPALARYLASAVPHPSGPQHFCIIGYRWGRDRLAWVHWREGNALILWNGRGATGAPDDSLRLSGRQLDLATDVVADEAAIGGSNYLVTRAWVARTLADCRAKGAHYAVIAPPRRHEGGE